MNRVAFGEPGVACNDGKIFSRDTKNGPTGRKRKEGGRKNRKYSCQPLPVISCICVPHHTQMSSARSVSSCVYQLTETREAEARGPLGSLQKKLKLHTRMAVCVGLVSGGPGSLSRGTPARVHLPAILFVRRKTSLHSLSKATSCF